IITHTHMQCVTGGVEQMLDTENQRATEVLSSKVSRLKSFALEIDKETEEHNQYLDGMDSEFMSVTGLLSGSVKRFSSMVRSGRDNRRLTCYLVAALVISFLVLYYLVWRVRT
uniref:BET1-like protein n=1 Tax=Petromyzon marinus TaxID=7757 RepID=S4RTV6_PETMA